MKVFSIKKEIRKVGFNYGLPVWKIDFGLGANMDLAAVMLKLKNMGMFKYDWVVMNKKCVNEQGVSTLIDGLKSVGCSVECEIDAFNKAPTWYEKPDRWTINWVPNGLFNYNGIRKNQDIIVCKDSQLDSMLKEFESNSLVTLGVVGNVGIEKLWLRKVRVYQDVN